MAVNDCPAGGGGGGAAAAAGGVLSRSAGDAGSGDVVAVTADARVGGDTRPAVGHLPGWDVGGAREGTVWAPVW